MALCAGRRATAAASENQERWRIQQKQRKWAREDTMRGADMGGTPCRARCLPGRKPLQVSRRAVHRGRERQRDGRQLPRVTGRRDKPGLLM